MKIIAIDVETTGLNVNQDQILQIGAVMFDSTDMETPVDELPSFETLVQYDRYTGDAFALQMNQAILLRLAKEGGAPPADAIFNLLRGFILDHSEEIENAQGFKKKVAPHPLGFNVAAFDIAMLKNHGLNPTLIHHRPFELGTMFAHPETGPAKSSEIIPKLLGTEVAHDALKDAQDAVELYRIWYSWRTS